MGWLKKATSGIWRPVRGIGRLLRGKGNEGLADIGHGVRTLAPIALGATGFGLPAALAAGAAGGAIERGGESNWRGKDIVGGAAKGAISGAVGHGAGSFGRAAAGKFLSGGAGAAAPTAAASAAPTAAAGPAPSVGMASSVAPSAAAPVGSAAATGVRLPPAAPSRIGKFLSGAGDAAKWAGRNAGDLGQAAGGVASLYGAGQESSERAWMRQMIEEDRLRKRNMSEALTPQYAEIIRSLMPSTN